MKRNNKKIKKRKRLKRILIKRKKRDIYLKRTFKKGNLKMKLSLLPNDIQKKIYIYSFKSFWRNYVPLTAKIPSWMGSKNYVKNTLWEAKLNNIHFLHLPFNTLPENKEWIMGCQCEFCINDNNISEMEKYCHYLVQYRDSHYFVEKFMEKNSTTSSNWNEYLYPISISSDGSIELEKIFDPLCGSYKENSFTKKLRNNIPFAFSDYN